MGLRDNVQAVEDVQESLVKVPMWNDEPVLFRGISYAALTQIQGVNLEGAQNGNLNEMIITLQATMADPETKELVFEGPEGAEILRSKSFEAIMFCFKEASKVLGIDPENEAGKGSSSTETANKTTAA